MVAPGAIERDEAERFDRGLVGRMAELGLLAGPFPEAVGGAGLSARGLDGRGRGDRGRRHGARRHPCVHVLHQNPVVRWGTDEQKARWLPALQAGEALGAFALTEPEAGSNAAAIRMRAERVGPAEAPDGLPADGDEGLDLERARGRALPRRSRRWTPPAGRRRSPPSSWRRGRPGFRFGAHEKKMGIRSCPAAELVFDGAEVPAANRLGAEGEGYRVALSALGDGRIAIAAACTGLARSALEQAAAYLGERTAYGAPIAELQGLRFMIAEMAQQRGGRARPHPRGRRDPRPGRRRGRGGGGRVAGEVDRLGRGDAGRRRTPCSSSAAPATRGRPAWSA